MRALLCVPPTKSCVRYVSCKHYSQLSAMHTEASDYVCHLMHFGMFIVL